MKFNLVLCWPWIIRANIELNQMEVTLCLFQKLLSTWQQKEVFICI